MNGEIIIYDEDDNHNYKRIKIGNGKTNVNDLPFTTDDIQNQLSNKVNIAQGEDNANKILITDINGNITLINRTTNEEVINMLASINALNAVTDKNGNILTDESNNILLW